VVDRGELRRSRCDPRLLPGRGFGGPPLLAVPRRARAQRAAAALVRARPLRLIGMPELPAKISAFDRLSRTIGDGSLRPHGDKPARAIRGGGVGPDAMPGYAELQVTSNFSFLRGASHPDELVVTAAAFGHAAIAITDRNSLART